MTVWWKQRERERGGRNCLVSLEPDAAERLITVVCVNVRARRARVLSRSRERGISRSAESSPIVSFFQHVRVCVVVVVVVHHRPIRCARCQLSFKCEMMRVPRVDATVAWASCLLY